MKEKVLYINLPYGASYRRVEVTENSRIGIVYAEQDVSNEEVMKASVTDLIPEPIPLIGGTEVYQKDNGTPYWYCKIKEGRDEFMHLYFEDLTEKDLLYYANGDERKFVTKWQKKFKEDVLKALKNKPKEGYRWLPVFEPSKNSEGNLQYVAGATVLKGLDSYEWEDLFNKYSPDNGSQESSITTYFLLLLRWLKDGVATLEELADDSRRISHYWNSENTKHDFEKTGEYEFGGIYGFVGNTHKIVKDSESGFSLVSGNCYGNKCPLAYVYHIIFPYNTRYDSIGILELIK